MTKRARVLQARADELGSRVKRTRVDASAPIDEINLALAAAVLGELRRKGVSARSGEPVGAALLDGETRAAARLPGRMERFDIEVGSRRLPGRHGRRACAVQHRGRACAISRLRPISPVRAWRSSRSPPTRTRRVSWPNSASAPRPSSSPICRDRAGAARRPSCRRSPSSLGLTSEVEPDAKRALKRGLELARQANAWLLVTGSLYLVGALRGAIVEAAGRHPPP